MKILDNLLNSNKKIRDFIMSDFEQKVISLLETINNKLDSLLEAKSQTRTVSHSIPEASGTVKPSSVVEKQEEEEKAMEKPPIEGRRVCPKCGGTSFNTVEDQSQVLFQQGGMKIYAKKYICKACGTEV
jgi:predicted nucleic-acid-binding Zn-ribbon protein